MIFMALMAIFQIGMQVEQAALVAASPYPRAVDGRSLSRRGTRSKQTKNNPPRR
jgi:hypothetical protein